MDKSLIPTNNHNKSIPLPTKPQPPVSLIRPLGIVWTLYATTYTVANAGDSLSARFPHQHAGLLAGVATVAVNVPLGIWKDLRFAQLFAGRAQEAIPKVSKEVVGKEMSMMGLGTGKRPAVLAAAARRGGGRLATGAFLLRDVITIVASFTLAPRCAEDLTRSGLLEGRSQMDLQTDPPGQNAADVPVEASQKAIVVAQLVVPVLSQVVATPVHLVGLDSFSRPRASWAERMVYLKRHVLSTTVGRCLRIIPAFGVGCLVNTELRLLFS